MFSSAVISTGGEHTTITAISTTPAITVENKAILSTSPTLTCTQSMGCLEKEDLTDGEVDEPAEAMEFLPPPPPPPASDHLPVADITEAVIVWAMAAPAPVGKAMDRGLPRVGGDKRSSSSSPPMMSPPLIEPAARTRTTL